MEKALVVISSVVWFAIAGGLVFYALPRHWSGASQDKDLEAWRVLPYSDEFKHGLKRLLPMLAFVCTATSIMIIGGWMLELGVNNSLLIAALFAPGLVSIVLFPIFWYLVIYRNRPRFLVAPHYRDEIGVTEFRRRNGTLRKTRIRLALIWAGSIAFVGACVLLGFMNR